MNSRIAPIAQVSPLGGLFWLVVYIVLVLGCNFVQMLSMLVYPFSKKAFRGINRGVAIFYWGFIAWGMTTLLRTRIAITGDARVPNENAIVICNHQSMTDICALIFLTLGTGRIGDLKWFVKDMIKYVPGPGWGLRFIDGIFVKRNWFKDKAKIYGIFAKFLREKIPFWIVTFPEGTRFTPEKSKRSQDYATRHKIHAPKHVLLPRSKGFVATVQALRHETQAVYDVTIKYPVGSPSLVGFFFVRELPIVIKVKRYPMEQMPQSEEELREWLNQRFVEKDAFLSR